MLNKQIAESELILNKRGGIYHLDLLPDEICENIIVVGDPDRVSLIASQFDQTFFSNQHREFASATGRIGQKEFTVLSTGIGTDNIDIVWNELDALANIDFTTRSIRPTHTTLNVFRVGTCGAIQPSVNLGDFIFSTHSIGLDNLYWFYQQKPLADFEFHAALLSFSQQIDLPITPYVSAASKHFSDLFKHIKNQGFTLTAPGFYAPQGRKLRLSHVPANGIMDWQKFSFNQQRILNFEMETSALFSLGNQLGHNVGALCVALANRDNNTFHKQPEQAVIRLIDEALSVLTS
jgi:uridine phosphorylase